MSHSYSKIKWKKNQITDPIVKKNNFTFHPVFLKAEVNIKYTSKFVFFQRNRYKKPQTTNTEISTEKSS